MAIFGEFAGRMMRAAGPTGTQPCSALIIHTPSGAKSHRLTIAIEEINDGYPFHAVSPDRRQDTKPCAY